MKKTLQEYIDDTVEQVAPHSSEDEKKQYGKILERFLTQGGSIAEAMEVTPEMMSILYDHAHRLYSSGQYKDASLAFALLVSVEPKNSTYFFGLGASYHMLKDYLESAQAYRASFYQDIKNPLPLYHAADCYIKINEPESAVFYLGLAMEVAGDRPEYATIKERASMMLQGLINQLRREAAEENKP